jgi:NADH:ubiquinone oxidoreductase subunit 4 (subunit M)
MSKMGTYALVRFGVGLFPEEAQAWALPVLVLAVVSILHGALVAMVQTDLKRLLAYSSLSHLGFVTLGVFSFTAYGVEGAMFHMVAHGVTTGALFLLVAMLETRRQTTDLGEFGGLAQAMPRFAFLMVLASLASAGVPFTNGFIGEFLTLLGAFTATPGTLVCRRGGQRHGVVGGVSADGRAAYAFWAAQSHLRDAGCRLAGSADRGAAGSSDAGDGHRPPVLSGDHAPGGAAGGHGNLPPVLNTLTFT